MIQPDPRSPVPLYHQIAEALAYQIATGRLLPGAVLSPVRDAAKTLGVNLHTVRRAYAELAERGLVEIRGPRGTRVADRIGTGRASDREFSVVQRFIERIVREAARDHALTSRELARRIAAHSGAAPIPRVSVVECSESQCRDHAAELEARWLVSARPWPLSRKGAPPRGPIIATYFHREEIVSRWPRRRDDLQFVAIQPDPGLRATLKQKAAPHTARLCEFDEPKAMNIAADVSALLAGRGWRIEPCVVARSQTALRGVGPQEVVLFSPRAWGGLSPALQRDPRAVKVCYVIVPEALEAIGPRLGWESQSARR